ncbi:MAG TPA: hypothetical protein ENK19_01830, partial [Acidobacteria bacterium]|nr:hypothetical protein [Acidobacteriota bacterium]
MAGVVFYLLVLVAGLGGYAVLVRLGLADREAWAGGRMAGLVAVALPAWWAAVAGLGHWMWAGFLLLAAAGIWGGWVVWRRREHWRELAAAEAVFTVFFVTVIALRLDHPDIRGTEKPMDMGILGTLLRARSFPPPDMWLAGSTLPYYYWGALVWTIPLAASRLAPEIGYNLIVGLLAGATGALAWAIAGRWSRPARGALLAAFVTVLAGTPDGLRQLLAGKPLGGLDYWASSRQVANAITEFPLFTFWLGDLHPHLLSLPLALLTVLLALHVGRKGLSWTGVTAVSAAFGVTWAANPWAMPPTFVAAGLALLGGDGRWRWPGREGWRRWLTLPAVAVGGWLATAPFQLAFHPPFHGLGLVHAWTTVLELGLYGFPLMVAATGAAMAVLASLGGDEPEKRQALAWGFLAVALLAGAVSGKPVLVITGLVALALTVEGLGPGQRPERPAVLLAALGMFLFFVPEVLFVRDPYGAELHRMNTIFKSWFQGWVFLALAFPVLIRRWVPARRKRWVAVALLLAPGLVHLAGMASGLVSHRPLGLDGFRWLSRGDRAAIHELRLTPPGTVLVEAVGGAYSDYARLSAGSGVPAVIGWGNHELVWRGNGILPEVERRKKLVKRIYESG